MDITINPTRLQGSVAVPPSKSLAHRYLVCGAMGKKPIRIICPNAGDDIAATVDCLNAIGAKIEHTDFGYTLQPIAQVPASAQLPCRESGSTLRFLLPIVGALGIDATFILDDRLSQRPLSPLWEEMERMGCVLSRPTLNTVRCTGKLRPGLYRMDGRVSSQFISGLMMALPLIGGQSHLEIRGEIQSQPYMEMTRQVQKQFTDGCQEEIEVELDWSNAAFWISANALNSQIRTTQDRLPSCQGDRTIVDILPKLEDTCTTICAKDIPDLIPILSVVAAAKHGAVFTDIQRLRLKESDRVASIIAMLEDLGGKAESTESTLTVYGTGLHGGTVDSFRDHRIAMSAAIAATVCKAPVTILGAECTKKSYPKFWDDYAQLGGQYEKLLR